MTFDFQLLFALLIASGGGGGGSLAWQPNADVQVLQIDTTAAVVMGTALITYPTVSTDGVLFACSQAGRYDCSFTVKAGQFLFAARSGLGAYTIGLAYQIQTTDPSLTRSGA